MADKNVNLIIDVNSKEVIKDIDRVKKSISNFGTSSEKAVKKTSASWSSFKGNLAANFVTGAIRDIGRAFIQFSKDSFQMAVDAGETVSKFETIFRDISSSANDMAVSLQKSYGLGIIESKNMLAATGDLLTGLVFTQK